MWIRHHAFLQVVRETWDPPIGFFGMRNLQVKLVRTKQKLKHWNRVVFGNVFDKLRLAQEAIASAEAAFDGDPSPDNRMELNRCHAEYQLRLKMEEDFWRQKSAVRWVVEGERNTKFFQGFVKQKRYKSWIHSVEDAGIIRTEDSDIRASAVRFFQSLLSTDMDFLATPVDGFFPSLPSSLDFVALYDMPTPQEVRDAVFGIDPSSVSGPDGFSSLFFQHCWDLVQRDVEDAVIDFFSGNQMP